MYGDTVPPSGAGTAHQVSVVPNPDSQAARRSIIRGVGVALMLMLLIGGINMLRLRDETWRTVLGACFTLVGAVGVGWWTRKVWTHLVQLRRIHLSHCAHCGYHITVLKKDRCPECGKDPFEPA